ncbi:MAG: hypothetical protein ACOH1P_03555 [Lysobacter sp.]
MRFDRLVTKVARAEDALEANERRVGADLRQLARSWKSAWTPGRIVVAGLTSGFLVGRAEPLRAAARGGGMVRIVSLLTSVFASTHVAAAVAADEADHTLRNADAMTGPMADGIPSTDAALAAGERLAHDYLERVAAAARQAGGTREP